MTARDLDIILFGATGFVGRLTARHLMGSLQQHEPEARIGLAGRSQERLARAREQLGPKARDWPLIVADADDAGSLTAMAQRAAVVVSTVGPYAEHGLALVGACAAAGTHYADLTGEVFFVRASIDAFDNAARATSARIVHSCGADAVPSDLAVLVTADAAREAGDGELATVDAYWRQLRGGASGGTLASMAGDIATRRADRAKARLGADPYALSPDRDAEPEARGVRARMAVGRARSLDGWEAPYLLSGYNAQTVRRSNALAGYAYGRSLRYHEALATGTSALAPVLAGVAAAGQGALAAGFATSLGRAVLSRFLPKPGEGPSERSMAGGRFLLEVHATTTTGARWVTQVSASLDPGYGGTAVMLGESALALAFDGAALPRSAGGGGVLTPASGIGAVLVERLRSRGFRIEAQRATDRGPARD